MKVYAVWDGGDWDDRPELCALYATRDLAERDARERSEDATREFYVEELKVLASIPEPPAPPSPEELAAERERLRLEARTPLPYEAN